MPVKFPSLSHNFIHMPSLNRFEASSDPSVRRGIIILVVVLLLLAGFFLWYNNRSGSLEKPLDSSGNPKEGVLSSIFNFSNKTDADEQTIKNDSDGDGLSDEDEKTARTDSQKIDSDGDGLSDREELKVYKTDALKADSDGDGISDGTEIRERTNPLDKTPGAPWPPRPSSL